MKKKELFRSKSLEKPSLDGGVKITSENIFSPGILKIHSAGRYRKGQEKLKVVSNPTIKRKNGKVNSKALALFKTNNPSTKNNSVQIRQKFPVSHPVEGNFMENASLVDGRDHDVRTPPATVDLFFSKYTGPNYTTRYQYTVCHEHIISGVETAKISMTFATSRHISGISTGQMRIVHLFGGCGKRFVNKSSMRNHVVSHETLKRVSCDQTGCPKFFLTERSMKEDFKQKHGSSEEKPFKCSECPESFFNTNWLNRHRHQNHPTVTFQCVCCCKLIRTSGSLIKHIETVHLKEGREECEDCGRVYVAKKTRHQEWHKNTKDYYCSICEVLVGDKGSFIAHSKTPNHLSLFQGSFKTQQMEKCPHTVELDGSESKDFYPVVEYDEVDKYNNKIFTACPSESNCRACALIVVATSVYYLNRKWIIPEPEEPFNCKSFMCLYLALLTKTKKDGQVVQQRYAGQCQNINGVGKRIVQHEDGHDGEQTMKTCAEISKESGAHIEMSNSRDQSLTFLITGKQSAVLEAKRSILAAFQTQAQMQVSIPKEHHRFVLGRLGANLSELETQTATKIIVPRPNEESNMITIQGTREGIEKAVHKIRLLSDEKSKQASERLSIPKKFHPFICGPNNVKVRALETENTGIRIIIPPPSVMSDEIYIAGEKDGVARASEIIRQEAEACKKYNQISIEIKKPQHRYIIGPKRTTINEIFATTGVMVELPPNDQPSDTVTLRGPTEALGTALNLVYEKANSVITRTVDAPAWIHKYIIGKKGANIRSITQGYNNVRVDVKVSDKESQIVIEGPPEEVEPVTEQFQACVSDLIENKYFKDIHVDPKYHKHIIGKNGANVNRLKEETGVIISVQDGQSAIIHLEGLRSGVETAAARLLEQVEKLEGEKETDLIIEHRFHGNIIGARGENISKIRDQFNQVQITFPAPGEKRDVVTVRGRKEDVDSCCRHLNNTYKEMLENSYQLKVPVFPQCYRLVVGKGGQNIKKIREDTKTRFDLPPLDEGKNKSEPEIIVITGKKENCEQARDKILDIQNSQANVVEIDVMISNQYHNWLIGTKGRLVQSISEDCGGVHIKFPDSKAKSDRVTLTGPKEDVEKAKSVLLEMTRNKEINSYTDTLEAKAQHHRFLIGKNGSNIRKIRESTNARIIFPNERDGDADIITIIGKKENVVEAKKQLQEILQDLDKIVEAEMDVDPRHHRHFVLRRGEVLHQISDDLGGVQISFPKANSNSSRVILKGAIECVEAAKKRIAQIADDLNNRIDIDVIIEQKHHRTIMGKGGSKVQQIQSDFNVEIKFPDRNDDPDFVSDENRDGVKVSDIIRVTGRAENCEGAKQALLNQVPVVVEVDIPFEMHRFIIGQKGRDVRELMRSYDVNITVPPSDQQSNTIVIMGSPKSAAAAKDALLERRDELEAKKAEQEARSFELQLHVDAEFHPKIIGKKGAVITEIRKKFDVNIQLPKKDPSNPDPNEDVITITGFEDKAKLARDEILKIVRELSEQVKEDIEIDHRVHSRIIGSRGKNVREIMKKFGVEIRFPRQGNLDLVSISGNDEDKVFEASDHLKNLAEEYLQDVNENEYMQQHTQDRDTGSWLQQFVREPGQGQESGGGGGGGGGGKKRDRESNGFVVKGAPWEQPPDTQSNEEFPSFGNGSVAPQVEPVGRLSTAWGPRKHF